MCFQEKSSGRTAHYKLTSTVMLWLQTNKTGSGTMNLGGSLTRQVGCCSEQKLFQLVKQCCRSSVSRAASLLCHRWRKTRRSENPHLTSPTSDASLKSVTLRPLGPNVRTSLWGMTHSVWGRVLTMISRNPIQF